MTKEQYVSGIKSAFVSISSNIAVAAIVAEFPFFANPIAATVLRYEVRKVMGIVADGGELEIFFLYTDFRVNKQGNDFVEAAFRNHQAQLSGTEEEKLNAEKDLFDKFATFAVLTT